MKRLGDSKKWARWKHPTSFSGSCQCTCFLFKGRWKPPKSADSQADALPPPRRVVRCVPSRPLAPFAADTSDDGRLSQPHLNVLAHAVQPPVSFHGEMPHSRPGLLNVCSAALLFSPAGCRSLGGRGEQAVSLRPSYLEVGHQTRIS